MKTIFEMGNSADGINLTDKTDKIDFLPEKFLRCQK